MDEDYVGKPQDIYLWCFISESKTAGVWGCPMRFTSGCCAVICITEKGRYLTLDVAVAIVRASIPTTPVMHELRHQAQERCKERCTSLCYFSLDSDSEDSV